MRLKPAVIVTGCPRSGSTILARILALSFRTIYLEEPLNQQTGIIGTDEPFVYLHEDAPYADTYDAIVKNILAGRAQYKTSYFRPKTHNPARLLFYAVFTNRYQARYMLGTYNPWSRIYITKDPTASFASEYLHRKFNYKVILTVRHPCAVLVSHQRLEWGSPLDLFLANPALKAQLSEEFQNLQVSELSAIESLAWYWRAIYEILTEFAKRNPDFIIVEHEYFSLHPLKVTRQLYRWLELKMTPRIIRKVQRLTSGGNTTDPTDNNVHVLKRNSKANVDRWKKLLPQSEVDIIMAITSETYEKFCQLPNNLAVQSKQKTEKLARSREALIKELSYSQK